MSGARVVLVTHPSKGAKRFAERLVELRLAACVNLVKITSVFRWNERLETAPETQLVIKTLDDRVAALERHVRAEHPYDTPEFVVLAAERTEPRYQRWMAQETRPD